MVAYSFAPQFVEAVASLKKRQTIRGARKRHALPGEPIQLYAGMRTKYCRKLVTVDPVCIDVRHIAIELSSRHEQLITRLEIEGVPLGDDELEVFAAADGFGGALADGFARRRMGEFWVRHHDWATFIGVLIRWEPRVV
jgi:hypothetical protein